MLPPENSKKRLGKAFQGNDRGPSSRFNDEMRMKKKRPGRRQDVEISPTDHVRGSPLAKVTLIGYGDFSNPDCTRTYRTVKRIQKKMGSRLRYVFRSFSQPLEFSNSEEAAEAAECASSQGKFWEMHDRMFEKQGGSDELHLTRCAKEVGLDVRKFRREMSGHVHRAKIHADRRAGVRLGVLRAPAFFINSVRHESSFGLATLLPAVQAAAGDP
jgi:protein-disulfide isomerase